MKWHFLLALVILAFAVACAKTQEAAQPVQTEKILQTAEQPKAPLLSIISPADNSVIKGSNVIIKVKAQNFNLVSVGQQPIKDDEGHFHVWLDGKKQLGPQTEFNFTDVASGKHTIAAELVRSNHSSFTPRINKSITINVESSANSATSQEGVAQQGNEFTVEADDNGFYPSQIDAQDKNKITINFKFNDDSIYYGGLDIKGPFPTLKHRLGDKQALSAAFILDGDAKIDSYWPSSGVHKATLTVKAK